MREGARVVVTGRRVAEGEAVARRLGPDARFVAADLLDDVASRDVVARTVEWFGRIDILVNNAGTPGQAVSVTDLDLADFDRALAVHVRAPLALIQHAARHMLPRRSGSIINVASVSGLRAGFSGPDYSIAKAAMVHLTRCAAVDLGQSGIRVNTISPGPVATGIHAKAVGAAGAAADEVPDEPLFAQFLPQFQPDPHIGRPRTSPRPRCSSRVRARGSSTGRTSSWTAHSLRGARGRSPRLSARPWSRRSRQQAVDSVRRRDCRAACGA